MARPGACAIRAYDVHTHVWHGLVLLGASLSFTMYMYVDLEP